MYKTKDVCAIIVSYNCDQVIVENVKALREQVGHILVVDNASDVISRNIITDISRELCVTVIYNKVNEGIGHALNQGLDFAKKNKYKLILTMDQDTVLYDDAVQKMVDILNNDKCIVSVGPVRGSNNRIYSKAKYEIVSYLITSGNLIRVDKALAIDGYNEKMFIDGVDFDFSLKLRSRGNFIARSNYAHMKHKVGEEEDAKFFCLRFKILSHSPLRHYYIYRNNLYILKKYLFKYPFFCLKKQIILLLYSIQVLLIQGNKIEKLSMMCRGIKDAIRNRYGRYC